VIPGHRTESWLTRRAPPGLGVWDGNPEVFEIDPDALGRDHLELAAGSRLTAEGVLAYSFGDYQLWPTSTEVLDHAVVGEYRIDVGSQCELLSRERGRAGVRRLSGRAPDAIVGPRRTGDHLRAEGPGRRRGASDAVTTGLLVRPRLPGVACPPGTAELQLGTSCHGDRPHPPVKWDTDERGFARIPPPAHTSQTRRREDTKASRRHRISELAKGASTRSD
jgi:hypothetical protein